MERRSDSTGNYAIALANAAKGIVSIPTLPNAKVPAVKWKRWQTAMPSPELLQEWFLGKDYGIAIVTTGMVVFDCEQPEQAERVLRECGDTPHQLQTPGGGIHLGYRKRQGIVVRNQVKILGEPIDIRTDGGLEMIPNSCTEQGAYRWIGTGLRPVAELPLARIGWTRSRPRTRRMRFHPMDNPTQPSQSQVRHPEGYCLSIPSVQGANGSAGLVKAICVLRDASRSPEQTFTFIADTWNARCAVPMWSDEEIRYAIRRHYRLASF